MNGKRFACVTGAILALLWSATAGISADGANSQVTDIGMQQRRVQRDFQDLEQKVLQVLDGLRKTDPERAAQLQAAFDWAREKVLSQRMNGVAELLNASQLVEASDLQSGMLTDLEAMQQMLQDPPSEYERLRKQIALVQTWLNTTVELAWEQWRLMRISERAQNPGAEQKRMKEQIAGVESLLTAQAELRKRTERAQAAVQPRLDEETREQQKLEQETRAILASIQAGGQAGGQADGQTGGEQPDQTGQPDQADQPQQSSGATGAGGAAAQAGEPPRPRPDGANNQTPQASTRPPEAGEHLLSLAIQSQMLSTENLAAMKPHAALTNQTQAVEKLEMALRELHFELARQQELDTQKAKTDQDALEGKTAKLFNDMVQSAPQEPRNNPLLIAPQSPGDTGNNPNSLPGTQPTLDSPYAQPPPPQQQMQGQGARNTSPDFAAGVNTGASSSPGHPQGLGTTTPGWNSVELARPMIQQAVQVMMKASKSLATNRLDVAAPLQRQAYGQLAVTAAQLEQWLTNTRDQQRAALRPRLKEMLQDMLTRQESASARTKALDEVRQKGTWTNENRQALAAVCAGEKEILQLTDKARDVLIEDGSSVAFNGVMAETQNLIEEVMLLLDREETGVQVQNNQREIERILAALIVATEQNQQTLIPIEQKNYVKPPRQRKAAPLFPLGTELRLLKAQQAWINRCTAAIRRDSQAGIRPEHARELRILTARQVRVHEMTKDIIRKLAE